MLPLQPLRSHARANPTNKPWAWRSSANRIAPRLCRFVTPGNPDSNLLGTALGRELINAPSGGLLESAVEPRAAFTRCRWHFRKVPGADIAHSSDFRVFFAT